MLVVFFFQAEDGIRDGTVTGVQTCALPILKVCQGKAERAGFEPAVRFDPHTAFPVPHLRPLGHLSGRKFEIRKPKSETNSKSRYSLAVCSSQHYKEARKAGKVKTAFFLLSCIPYCLCLGLVSIRLKRYEN